MMKNMKEIAISMETIGKNLSDSHEIARLAFFNWQKDGCPAGRDLDYWLAAEGDISALEQLPSAEREPAIRHVVVPEVSKPEAATKSVRRLKPRTRQKIT